MITTACLCGAVRITLDARPDKITQCNCSACRRFGALWAYAPLDDVSVSGTTVAYVRGDKSLAFHHCPTCGCVTHWWPLNLDQSPPYAGVNMALADPAAIAGIPMRRFDGAETWQFLD